MKELEDMDLDEDDFLSLESCFVGILQNEEIETQYKTISRKMTKEELEYFHMSIVEDGFLLMARRIDYF